MTIEELKAAKLENWLYTDIDNMTRHQQAWLDLAPKVLALVEAIKNDATFITDGSDPKGGWIGRDEEVHVWDAFMDLNTKLEAL